MGAAGIELADFVTEDRVEHVYRRMFALRDLGERDPHGRRMLIRGMNMARAKHGGMLLFLEKGAEILRQLNDSQICRLQQDGAEFSRCDFTEFSSWKEAYMLAADGNDTVKFRVFGWTYAACAEYLT